MSIALWNREMFPNCPECGGCGWADCDQEVGCRHCDGYGDLGCVKCRRALREETNEEHLCLECYARLQEHEGAQ